jgi:hypothetical protein
MMSDLENLLAGREDFLVQCLGGDAGIRREDDATP